jgi:hypothetical protein
MLKIDNLSNEIDMTAVRGGAGDVNIVSAPWAAAGNSNSGNSFASPQTSLAFNIAPVSVTSVDTSSTQYLAQAMGGVAAII